MPTRLFAPVSKRAINAKTYDQLSLRDYMHNTINVIPGEYVLASYTDRITGAVLQRAPFKIPYYTRLYFESMDSEYFTEVFNTTMEFCQDNFPNWKPGLINSDLLTENVLLTSNRDEYIYDHGKFVAMTLSGKTFDPVTNTYNEDVNLQAMIIFGLPGIPRIIVGTCLDTICPDAISSRWYVLINKFRFRDNDIMTSDVFLKMDGNVIPGTIDDSNGFDGITVMPLTSYNLRKLLLEFGDYKHNTYLARFEEFVPWYVN